MGTFWQSLRYTLRVLAKSPLFTIVAILSLALGIGANTAIFTLINALLLRNLPVHQPERLVQLVAIRPDGKVPFSYPMFREVERAQRVFTGLIGWGAAGMLNVEVNGVLARNHLMTVTGNCYSELGITPLLGRLLVPEDSDPRSGTSSQVAVLGYEFWRSRFGGASDVVGKQIRVEGHPFTIIGVTRKWFSGMTTGEPPDITIPSLPIPSSLKGMNSLSKAVLYFGSLQPAASRMASRSSRLARNSNLSGRKSSSPRPLRKLPGLAARGFSRWAWKSHRPQRVSQAACVRNLRDRSTFS